MFITIYFNFLYKSASNMQYKIIGEFIYILSLWAGVLKQKSWFWQLLDIWLYAGVWNLN